jgi:SOS-response transcriptional repressor LexA
MRSLGPVTHVMRDTLAFIAERVGNGLPPSNREILVRFGLRSTNAVNDRLKSLERHGLIERDKQRARAIFLTPRGRREAAAASLYATSTGAEVSNDAA